MKITEVVLNTKVRANYISHNRKALIGEIVSAEIKRQSGGGQFQVLVQYEKESAPRWVAGGNLVKVEW